jgi:hypothetical protein
MRLVINGFVVEGSPDEVGELLRLEQRKKKEPAPRVEPEPEPEPVPELVVPVVKPAPIKFIPRSNKRYKANSKEFKDKLLEAVKYSMAHKVSLHAGLSAVFPERKGFAGYEMKRCRRIARKLGFNYKQTRIIGATESKIRASRKGVLTDGRVIRFRFMNGRVKSLTREGGMSYEKAWEFARDEWNAHKKAKINPSEAVSFPFFTSVKPELNTILRDVTERVIKSRGVISFVGEGYVLGLDNVRDWLVFIREFMIKAELVARYFGVLNRFRIINNTSISYGGN